MELKYNDVFFHINQWFWGESVDIVKDDGTAKVCVKFDEKSFPKIGYICDLSVIATERRKGIGKKMIKYALMCCEDHRMTFARLHVDKKIFGYANGTKDLGSRNFQETKMSWK